MTGMAARTEATQNTGAAARTEATQSKESRP